MRSSLRPFGRKTALAAVLTATIPAAFAAPGDPLTAPFTVATGITNDYGLSPALAHDAAGNFVVAWQSGDSTVMARLFNAGGSPRGAAFVVSSTAFGPAVAMDAAGDFVVSWRVRDGVVRDTGLRAQRYGASGTAVGTAINVGAPTSVQEVSPAVAMDADGDFVVAWGQDFDLQLPVPGLGYGIDVGSSSVRAQRFSHTGARSGAQAVVDLRTTNPSLVGSETLMQPVLAMNPAGNFTLAWANNDLLYREQSYVRRYSLGGTLPGLVTKANPASQTQAYQPAVAMDDNGNYAVSWSVAHKTGPNSTSGYDLFVQSYGKSGAASGKPVQVNQAASLDAGSALAMDSTGKFAVAWAGLSCCSVAVQLQAYTAAGAAAGGIADIAPSGRRPALALAGGHIVAVWAAGDGSLNGELLAGP